MDITEIVIGAGVAFGVSKLLSKLSGTPAANRPVVDANGKTLSMTVGWGAMSMEERAREVATVTPTGKKSDTLTAAQVLAKVAAAGALPSGQPPATARVMVRYLSSGNSSTPVAESLATAWQINRSVHPNKRIVADQSSTADYLEWDRRANA